MIVTEQPVTAQFHGVAPTSHGQIVGSFVAAPDRKVREKDLIPQIRKPRDVESGLPEHIGNYVKAVVIKLRTGFVYSVRAEESQPGALNRVVIGANGTAPRKARQ